ncbi:PAAR-like domain-containing protein [Paraglaciecola sp.]|uniref:PAAR-like domain-containing protein n=1 Tax=Paraglaciecola sp. TaxID=1920173 RepID=UPI003EF38D9E
MFGISTKGGGMSNAMPDVCKTPAPPAPPIPIPYPNIASFTQANPGTCSKKVKVLNQAVVSKDTIITMTSGDEAGSIGGVVSGMIKGPAKAKTFSQKVKIEGKNVVYQTCTIGQNGSNPNAPAGIHSVPSQTTVLVSG